MVVVVVVVCCCCVVVDDAGEEEGVFTNIRSENRNESPEYNKIKSTASEARLQ